MTRQEAIKQVRERWERQKLNPENYPNVFISDVDITMGCNCGHVFIHPETCPAYQAAEVEETEVEGEGSDTGDPNEMEHSQHGYSYGKFQ
jgi:hypothetical protein